MKKNKLVVVKVGTKVITDDDGRLNLSVMRSITRQIAQIRSEGAQCVLVTSGAVRAGMELLNLKQVPKSMFKLQAAAACGQNRLMDLYTNYFKKKDILTAQILLTQDDFDDRHRYLSLRHTLESLLAMGAQPIVNENDTISTAEISLGDNDILASKLAVFLNADLLIAATNIDGLINNKGKLIHTMTVPLKSVQTEIIDGHKFIVGAKDIDITLAPLSGNIFSSQGKGGMFSKFNMMYHAAECGTGGYIVNGKKSNSVYKAFLRKKVGTCFIARKTAKTKAAKHIWISFASKTKGEIVVDDGAREALLKKNKSLLPSGIVDLAGDFSVGDVIGIRSASKKTFAKGIAEYNSYELKKIMGLKSSQIKDALGYFRSEEVIHKDNLAITK